MTKRLEQSMAGERLPGHYRPDLMPVGLWQR
jgi:hypothetical protein